MRNEIYSKPGHRPYLPDVYVHRGGRPSSAPAKTSSVKPFGVILFFSSVVDGRDVMIGASDPVSDTLALRLRTGIGAHRTAIPRATPVGRRRSGG